MTMRVMNNTAAMLALGETTKNQNTLSKQLKKVSTGMKITNAGDGASEYSISEKMRVKLRALGQAEENVQTGVSLLHVAEGGIQQQIDILKTVKEKVLAASNDTATDTDRQIIQKEINQSYDQMQDIAAITTYNNRRVLLGGSLTDQVSSWVVKDSAVPVPDSDAMSVIPDNYDKLDGVTGPFDIFKEYRTNSSTMTTLGLFASQNFKDGTAGTANTIDMDLSSYNSVDALDNVGYAIGGWWYVFTKDTNRNYQNIDRKIDISKCNTISEVAALIKNAYCPPAAASSSNALVTFTTNEKSANANTTTVTGITRSGGSVTSGGSTGRSASAATGLFVSSAYLSGGSNQIGTSGSSDPDAKYTAGTAATLSVNVSSIAGGSGITLHGSSTVYLQFVEGTSGVSYSSSTGVYSVGKNASVSSYSLGNSMYLSMSGGIMTLSSSAASGGTGNSYFVTDSIPAVAGTSTTTTEYTAVTAYSGTVTNHKTGSDGDTASYTIDLSSYNNTSDAAKLNELINDLAGKSISYDGYTYEFLDSAASPALSSINKINRSTTIDLNSLRSSVNAATTIASALGALLKNRLANSSLVTDASGTITGLKLTASSTGTAGNNQTIIVETGQLRSYDINYSNWFASSHPSPLADYLNGKGFRAYCATDSAQWFNFIFTNGDAIDADKPKSGTSSQDIKSILINVADVTDANSFVKAIYEQATPILTGADPSYNHHMRLAADTQNGVLTLYDDRRYAVNDTNVYDYQEKGAKIADGVMDNVIKSVRNVYSDDLVIQHTDKASMNIHIKIPRTTLDHIFGYQTDEHIPSDYSVLTKTMREKLLGIPPNNGILDNGIEYLISANTLIGAQTNHLDNAHANLTTETEHLTAVESKIRDADMASEMTSYAKANILSQSAQAMLSQANQSAGNILSLLQH